MRIHLRLQRQHLAPHFVDTAYHRLLHGQFEIPDDSVECQVQFPQLVPLLRIDERDFFQVFICMKILHHIAESSDGFGCFPYDLHLTEPDDEHHADNQYCKPDERRDNRIDEPYIF